MRTLLLPLLFLWASAACAADAPIKVDGHIDPDEWAGAQHITNFRLTQPLSRAPSPYPTEAWIKSTPEGLAVAFRNTQPANVPRTRQSAPRDAGGPYDRVNLYVDYDGDGHVGYNFMVMLSDSIQDETITNENQFSTDWDGNWKHAVSEDGDTWSVEMLIPWYIAPMKKGQGGKRTIGIQLDRVIGTTGERVGWPAIFGGETRFLSAFEKVEVADYSQSLLAVTPFVSAVYDNIAKKAHFDTGTDIFWKPTGSFQLSATLNPDFGQVESDDLVVNFSAVPTFFSDKRPFFTENQSFFNVPFGSYNNNDQLLYTRRVGGPTDDGSGLAGDVTAAVKANGSLGSLNYGVFAASEADAVGRNFEAVRMTRDFATQGFGAMITNVDHPFLDRTATVYEFDHRWKPDPQWNVRTVVVGSAIDQAGQTIDDSGAQVQVDYDMGKGWRQQLYAEHLGHDLQLDDFGFLDRNNFNYARYDLGKRITDLPKESIYASHDWHVAVSRRVNDDGVKIADAWSVNRQSDTRNGGNEYLEFTGLSTGKDDLITRGNGVVNVPAKLYGYYERFWPHGKGRWSFYGNVRYAAEGLHGPAHGSLQIDLNPTYFVNDQLSFYGELIAIHNPDWLLWQNTNLLGTFNSSQLQLNGGMQWTISSKQELRIKLETIALDARMRQAWRVAADGTPVATSDPVSDFNLRNLGFQIRYRYELAPLSNIYVAYVRGGFDFEDFPEGVVGLLGNAFSLHDSEQFLVKLSYRFEI